MNCNCSFVINVQLQLDLAIVFLGLYRMYTHLEDEYQLQVSNFIRPSLIFGKFTIHIPEIAD